jgi:hypothetical protein
VKKNGKIATKIADLFVSKGFTEGLPVLKLPALV